MNALALKQRLRDRLRARKFEMERLECSFRKQVNDHKVDAHTASSIKQREPAITKVARSFNVLCDTMEDLFNKGKAPPGAICPKKLEIKGIFALDVDDAIWEDLGLDEGSPVATLPWLSDEGVRAGIRALLEYDRCIEEKVRLRHECRSMHFWLSEEWRIVNLALGTGKNFDLLVNSLNFGNLASLPDWGPSAEDIINFHIAQKTAVLKEVPTIHTENNIELERQEWDEESEYSDSEHGEADMLLFDILDAVDASRSGAEDDEYLYDD
ncbi:hypothetical protein DXG01_011177 [Tephrocybe rancida]|nr:hypothetical protein DXG01_011177 [Tephrocybe rancida]